MLCFRSVPSIKITVAILGATQQALSAWSFNSNSFQQFLPSGSKPFRILRLCRASSAMRQVQARANVPHDSLMGVSTRSNESGIAGGHSRLTRACDESFQLPRSANTPRGFGSGVCNSAERTRRMGSSPPSTRHGWMKQPPLSGTPSQ